MVNKSTCEVGKQNLHLNASYLAIAIYCIVMHNDTQ